MHDGIIVKHIDSNAFIEAYLEDHFIFDSSPKKKSMLFISVEFASELL